ncbi:dTDP-glucose 4,6-dehydratase [Pasteurella sp. PK-2025]|uniref:dTDP-glucose 4,6-dehydratase n=1 Tax=unclassified Pasteurella TaxID=2621516 RepID=UPI003C70DD04
MKILITGGAGFIGSALIRYLLTQTTHSIINVDKLTYAANLAALQPLAQHPQYFFEQADIVDHNAMQRILSQYQPDAIMHLAAESHVDRSIVGAGAFIQTNIVGTYQLLDVVKAYWQQLPCDKQGRFRFLHVSTDEVYGDLALTASPWQEGTAYQPSSPYSASKASSDHLVLAWHRTYGLPTIITHCSNNYGPYQYPEKLIPFMIKQALQGKPLTLYGDGQQRREWLFVEDHVQALYLVLTKGKVGEHYHIGAENEKTNFSIVKEICQYLNQLRQEGQLEAFASQLVDIDDFQQLICFVQDRAGHDVRYRLNCDKIKQELGWQPNTAFKQGLQNTVQWYVTYFASQLTA